MANLSLSQLRDLQKANPPVDGAFVLATLPPEKFVAPILHKRSSLATDGTPAEGSLPLQASPPAPSVASGYCRIFPADFASLAHVPADWKAQNWVGNGPWQNLEGWPAHPDFEANLLAVETSPEVCGHAPGY